VLEESPYLSQMLPVIQAGLEGAAAAELAWVAVAVQPVTQALAGLGGSTEQMALLVRAVEVEAAVELAIMVAAWVSTDKDSMEIQDLTVVAQGVFSTAQRPMAEAVASATTTSTPALAPVALYGALAAPSPPLLVPPASYTESAQAVVARTRPPHAAVCAGRVGGKEGRALGH